MNEFDCAECGAEMSDGSDMLCAGCSFQEVEDAWPIGSESPGGFFGDLMDSIWRDNDAGSSAP